MARDTKALRRLVFVDRYRRASGTERKKFSLELPIEIAIGEKLVSVRARLEENSLFQPGRDNEVLPLDAERVTTSENRGDVILLNIMVTGILYFENFFSLEMWSALGQQHSLAFRRAEAQTRRAQRCLFRGWFSSGVV